MIIYNNKSTADILFRMRGSAFDGNIKLWVAVIVNVLESIFFIMYGVMEIEGVHEMRPIQTFESFEPTCK